MNNFLDDDDIFDSDFEESTENDIYRTQVFKKPYIKLKKKCTRLLEKLNTNEYETIRQTLLMNKIQYENKQDTISKQMYSLTKKIIDMHIKLTYSLNDMMNIVILKIEYCDNELRNINDTINSYVNKSALNDITSRHSNIYNTRRWTVIVVIVFLWLFFFCDCFFVCVL